MAKVLFTSDLHLTDRPQDEYRWTIFDFLDKEARLREVDAFAILGDITDAKDGHNARFANRIVDAIAALSERAKVVILKGNHDYTEEYGPFFAFLDKLPRVRFLVRPARIALGDEFGVFVPHVRYRPHDLGKRQSPKSGTEHALFSAQVQGLLREPHRFRCFHQTFKGAQLTSGANPQVATFGVETQILPALRISKKGYYHISGDVHIPQKAGLIHYCGAPHPINFGDDWSARVLFWDETELLSLPRVTIRKIVVRLTQEDMQLPAGLIPSDQVRVEVWVDRETLSDWRKHRHAIFDQANHHDINIESIQFHCTESAFVPELHPGAPIESDPHQALKRYSRENSLPPPLVKTGRRVLRRVR